MQRFLTRTNLLAVLAASLGLGWAPAARAHFLWLQVDREGAPGSARVRAFFNEDPVPDAAFKSYVRDVRLTIDGQLVPSALGAASRDARWAGREPAFVDAETDLGVVSRGGKSFRLYYTARAQTEPVSASSKETAGLLRVRLLKGEVKDQVEVLFDGKPAAGARIRLYPRQGEPSELTADSQGRATVPGISEGKTALWANRVDPTPGIRAGKAYPETRYYATLLFTPRVDSGENAPSAFATMPAPAVTSFGAAIVGKWLYVYGGHVGKTHHYNVETTSRHFRRLNLEDRSTWEDLPMGPDLQGVALVTDGKALYRTGGMAARNEPGKEQDMYSVAGCARFDIETRTWTDLPPLPEPRSTHDAAVLGRTLYVVGGWTMKGASEESTFLDHALALDLDNPSVGWKTVSQPFRRRALAAAAHAGKLYVLGGLTDADSGMKVERRVDVYDPSRNTWSRGPDLPRGERHEGFGSSAYELDGRLYVSGASGRIARLNTSGDGWELAGAWSLPRITHRLLPAPDHVLLAVGGSAKGQTTALIEAVRIPPAAADPVPSPLKQGTGAAAGQEPGNAARAASPARSNRGS